MKNNGKKYKGNLGRVQEIAEKLEQDAETCWRRAGEMRELAIDCLGNINHDVVRDIQKLSAKSTGLGEAAREIREIINGKISCKEELGKDLNMDHVES